MFLIKKVFCQLLTLPDIQYLIFRFIYSYLDKQFIQPNIFYIPEVLYYILHVIIRNNLRNFFKGARLLM